MALKGSKVALLGLILVLCTSLPADAGWRLRARFASRHCCCTPAAIQTSAAAPAPVTPSAPAHDCGARPSITNSLAVASTAQGVPQLAPPAPGEGFVTGYVLTVQVEVEQASAQK